MICFQNQKDNLKKWNADTDDIYDIKSRLVQYPFLQEARVYTHLFCLFQSKLW